MAQVHRIVWSEGLFITPHHFQQWDLFHEAQLSERIALTEAYPWGIHSMDVDGEALAAGSFRLLSLRALFPSGASVRIPEFDPPPASISFADAFDAKTDSLDIFLGVPHRRGGWPNCDLSEGAEELSEDVRFQARTVMVSDDNTGKNERAIQGAQLRLKLLLSTELRDNCECLSLARVVRNPQGEFRMLPDFIPPLLSIQASPTLMRIARALHEGLTSRAAELTGRFTEGGVDARDITPANLRAFLQFFTVNAAIPRLAHVRETEGSHPRELYRILSETAGQLCTFHAAERSARDVPPYNHQTLGATFGNLERFLRDLLRDSGQDPYQVIPLTAVGSNQYEGQIPDTEVFDSGAVLYLSLGAEGVGERSLIDAAARLIVSSPTRIRQLVSSTGRGSRWTMFPCPRLPFPAGAECSTSSSRIAASIGTPSVHPAALPSGCRRP